MFECVFYRKCVFFFFFTSLDAISHHQALEEALNLHPPAATQPQPGQGNHGDAASNLKKQELLTQVAVLKEQVRGGNIAVQKPPRATCERRTLVKPGGSVLCTPGEDL